MTDRGYARTLSMGSAHCRWTCRPGAIDAFFKAALASEGHPGRALAAVVEGPLVVVTDQNVNRLHGQVLPPAIPHIVIPAGEASKTFEVLEETLRRMLAVGLDRRGTVVAFGGGVVGDLAGFAAATFMRGVRWVNVPTTLLAMVDASIGGKTAVDVAGVKNLAGAFHPPLAIVADPTVLSTLPAEERASGMAEAVKQAIIGSPQLFERLEQGVFDDVADVAVAAQVKIAVVERDPLERGERAVLNLGHTVGHGIESVSQFSLSHGQAVAIGLVAEAHIAETMGLAAPGLSRRMASTLERFGLPTRTRLDPDAVRTAMGADKKRSAGRLKFALPKAIGEVVYGVDVDDVVVRQALEKVCPGG